MDGTMTVSELRALAMKHYNVGGDRIIECWTDSECQEWLDEGGTESMALELFSLWHEHAEGIRNTAF